MKRKDIVIDVSHHQKDNVIKAAKDSGINNVIVRAGYIGKNGINTDKKFVKFYSAAKQEGMSVGTYFYLYNGSRCQSPVKIARQICDMLTGYKFDLPIFLDIEDFPDDDKIHNQEWVVNCLNELEKHRMFVGIYGSDIRTFREMFYDGRGMAKRYYSWVARYGRDPQYIEDPPMHQYTDSGELKGYRGHVDMSYIYNNIQKTIIEGGFNGL